MSYRREEYNCLLKERVEEEELRTASEAVPAALGDYLERVTLVERLAPRRPCWVLIASARGRTRRSRQPEHQSTGTGCS